MKVRLEPSAREPLSEQLRAQLERRITAGRLLPGDRLPPVRELAVTLGLASNTVAKAYRVLEATGYLVARGRRGTFVAASLPTGRSDADRRLDEAARSFALRASQLGVTNEAAELAVRRALRR